MVGHVFVSYVRENAADIQRLVGDLEARGLSVWLDRARLAAGERWRDAIREAIRSGDLFLACFSRAYAQRARTHMNEELTLAIDELRLRPSDRAWFIPVVFDGGDVPDRAVGAGESLRDFQWVNLDENWAAGIEMIVSAATRTAKQYHSEPDIPVAVDALRHLDTDRPGSQPALIITTSLQRGASYWRNVTHQEVRVLLSISNDGPGAVAAPYIRMQFPRSFAVSPLGVTSRQSGAPLQLVQETGEPPAANLIARSDFVIYAGTSIQIAELTTTIRGSMRVPSCEMRFKIASAGLPARDIVLNVSADDIARFLNRTVEPNERE